MDDKIWLHSTSCNYKIGDLIKYSADTETEIFEVTQVNSYPETIEITLKRCEDS